MKQWCALVVFCFITMISGCAVLNPDEPPYVISKPVSISGSKSDFYNYAGVEFQFTNKNSKPVRSITVSCIVYDAVTKLNPFIGTNILELAYSGSIAPRETVPLIFSLDPYLYVAPATPYLLDFFSIASIQYSDGSSWEDKYGTYYTRSY